jgi:hypothetical protein
VSCSPRNVCRILESLTKLLSSQKGFFAGQEAERVGFMKERRRGMMERESEREEEKRCMMSLPVLNEVEQRKVVRQAEQYGEEIFSS